MGLSRGVHGEDTRWHWQQQLQNVWQSSGGASVFQHIIEGGPLGICRPPEPVQYLSYF